MALAHGDPVLRDLSWNLGHLRNLGRAAKYAERLVEAESIFGATFEQAERAGSPYAMVSLAAHHADGLDQAGPPRERVSRSLALPAPAAELFSVD
jgi:hypothetical protein